MWLKRILAAVGWLLLLRALADWIGQLAGLDLQHHKITLSLHSLTEFDNVDAPICPAILLRP